MDDWEKFGYASYEAWIESLAGQSLPCPFCGTPGMAVRVDHSLEEPCPGDSWPMPDVPDWSEEESSDPADQ